MLMKPTPGDDLPLTLGKKVEPEPLYEDGDPAQHAKDHGELVDAIIYAALKPRWIGGDATHGDLAHAASPAENKAWHADQATRPPASRLPIDAAPARRTIVFCGRRNMMRPSY